MIGGLSISDDDDDSGSDQSQVRPVSPRRMHVNMLLSCQFLGSVEKFNPLTSNWSWLPPINVERIGPVCVG